VNGWSVFVFSVLEKKEVDFFEEKFKKNDDFWSAYCHRVYVFWQGDT